MQSADVTYFGAFIAGILSFLSPCVLPLIPSYITYITGLSIADLESDENPQQGVGSTAILHSLSFIAGFTAIFVLLGASATFIGSYISEHTDIMRKIGGLLIALLGLHLTGILPITALLGEKRVNIQRKPAGFIGSFIVGIAFAAGWTPCIGPILASILLVASTEESVSRGIILLLIYSLGLGIPFLLSTIALERFISAFNRIKKYIRYIEVATGAFLLLIGTLLFFNLLTKITTYINKLLI